MNRQPGSTPEAKAGEAFSRQAPVFDATYSPDPSIAYKRQRVREHVMRLLRPKSSILELNAGTGEDAIYFAKHGHRVHATDISPGMQQELNAKVESMQLRDKISSEIISFTELGKLQKRGPYYLIFSNFAGLNCTGQLETVLKSLHQFQHPGDIVTLVILPKFCLWEFLLLFKGKFKTAFRRFFSSKGRSAKVEGVFFTCWYYSPSFVKRCMSQEYELIAHEGLCTFVPPSYLENFQLKYPKVFKKLSALEDKWKGAWPWRSIGDYYVVSFRKK